MVLPEIQWQINSVKIGILATECNCAFFLPPPGPGEKAAQQARSTRRCRSRDGACLSERRLAMGGRGGVLPGAEASMESSGDVLARAEASDGEQRRRACPSGGQLWRAAGACEANEGANVVGSGAAAPGVHVRPRRPRRHAGADCFSSKNLLYGVVVPRSDG